MTIKVSPVEEKKVVELNNASMEISKDNSTTGEEVKDDDNAKLLILRKDEEGNITVWQAKAGDFIQEEQPIDIEEIRREIAEAKDEAVTESSAIIDEKIDDCIDLIDESTGDIKDNITTIINEKTIYVDGEEVRNNSENRYFTIINEQTEPEKMEKVSVDEFIGKDGVDLSSENVIYVKPDISENVEGKIYKDYISAYNYIKNNENYENREWTIELCADELSNDEGKNNNDIIMDKNIIVKGRNTKIKSAVVPYSPLRIKLNLFAKHDSNGDYFTAIGYIIRMLTQSMIDIDYSGFHNLPNNEYVNLEEYIADNPMLKLAVFMMNNSAGNSANSIMIKIAVIAYFLYWANKENVLIVESDNQKLQNLIDEITADYEFMEEFVTDEVFNEICEKYEEFIGTGAVGNRSLIDAIYTVLGREHGRFNVVEKINKFYMYLKESAYITDCTITKIDLDKVYENFGITENDSAIKNFGDNIFRILNKIETAKDDETETTFDLDLDIDGYTDKERYFTFFTQFLNVKECDIKTVGENSVKANILQNVFRQLGESIAMVAKHYIKIENLIAIILGQIPMMQSLKFIEMYDESHPIIDYKKTFDNPLTKVIVNIFKNFMNRKNYNYVERFCYNNNLYMAVEESDLNRLRTTYGDDNIIIASNAEFPELIDSHRRLSDNRLCVFIGNIEYYDEHNPMPSNETLFTKLFKMIESICGTLSDGALDLNIMHFNKCRVFGDLNFPFNTAIISNQCNYVETELYEENLLTNTIRDNASLRTRQIVGLVYVGYKNTMKEQIFFNDTLLQMTDSMNLDDVLYINGFIYYFNLISSLLNFNVTNITDGDKNIINGLDKILIKLIKLYNNFMDENGNIKISIDPTILSPDYESEFDRTKSFIEVMNDIRGIMFANDGELINFSVGCPTNPNRYAVISDSTDFTNLKEIYEKYGMYLTATPDETNESINIADDEEYREFIKTASIHDIAMIIGLLLHNVIINNISHILLP